MRSSAALAESEDEWGPQDEQETQDMMVSAEESIPIRFAFDVTSSISPVPYPLWSLEAKGTRLELTSPLIVVIEQDDGAVIVSNPSLRIWGSGGDKYSALDDFVRTFIGVLDSYEATPPDELTEDATGYLRQLRSLIRTRTS